MLNKSKEIIFYIVFGVLTTVVNIVSYYLLAECISINYLLSNAIAWLLSVVFAYITNRKFVFESKSDSILLEMLKFFGARLGTGLMDMALMWIFISLLSFNDVYCKIVINVLVIIFNYLFSKLYVFKEGI